MRDDVSALILAGGRATRFGGVAKHELVVDGRTILERQATVLRSRVAEILVSSTADVAGYRTVRDAIAGAGPLVGIAAGLAATATPWLLVVAGDMPYLAGGVIDLLLARLGEVDAVAIMIDDLPQPLLCVLHARTRDIVDRRLAAGRYKASGLLTDEALRIRWIAEAEVRDCDPQLKSFVNLNEPQDLSVDK